MSSSKQMTYADTGVNYEAMDPFKRKAQLAGRETAKNLITRGFTEFEPSRGESAYLIECDDFYLAHVEEGLGTKNLVADALYELAWKFLCFESTGWDAVMMIVNDLITLGALPLSVLMHLAAGNDNWFKHEGRSYGIVKGFRDGCNAAHCSWGGGETPTLKGIVNPETFVISGSATGIIKPKERLLIGAKIQPGDAIILLASSGIHCNGLTLAREIATRGNSLAEKILRLISIGFIKSKRQPKGFLTKMEDGRAYGEALLDKTICYVPVMEECREADVELHYAVNITGHGWRKLMRANEPFNYVVDCIPEPPPIFRFIQEHGPVDDPEAYGNLNMGAGFALYAPESEVPKIIEISGRLGIPALHAGHIEKNANGKRVIIVPKNLEYGEETLKVR